MKEASGVWNTSSKLGLVADGLVQDLFHQINLNPTKEQINDMLRNAKLYSSNIRFCNGLSFGEFSILAADFRRFRTNPNGQPSFQITSLSPKSSLRIKKQLMLDQLASQTQSDSAGTSSNEESVVEAPEVFLGGSCNPTTWRADVAMPELKKLGISFYNPQVSQWTPDLIALEHRAKEKARVLFFVMDSETRASAGAIEAAHIAGQNQKPLILVLHPYKRNQKILNESISEEEYLDLSRNQKLLKQLVTRRGLPVLDSILTGLQKIKGIIAGEGPCALPQSVGSRLISVRRSYDRAINNDAGLTLAQCRQVLSTLGYRKDLITSDNLRRILSLVRDVLNNRHESSPATSSSSTESTESVDVNVVDMPCINFEEFCVISSYLSVLQQEIEDNCCQCSQSSDENTVINICHQQRHILNRSFTIDGTPATSATNEERHSVVIMSNGPRSDSSRDSGTSSPQPNEIIGKLLNGNSSSSLHTKMSIHVHHTDIGSGTTKTTTDDDDDVDSDSNDSVFSTSSSLDEDSMPSAFDERKQYDARDIYLGGSCMLRTKWRRDIALPYLKEKQITYSLPTLHENLTLKQMKKLKNGTEESQQLLIQEVEDSDGNGSLMYNPRILDSSRVLLFVITNETRSLAPMTLAAHYIGLGYNVVLCVQMLPDNCKIGHDLLTPSAIKDYNRGRSYLSDLAKRQNIPVFSEIKPAIDCAIEKVKFSKPRCSV
ncbi:CLUMA_CG001409, isoform A [Clunio marinus]|uniref:CLUMA_CG001409, isoform A n=1 Tax=Clunio marinus TaxID=568069 RepID=A0A1J1HHX9_9DIPT|nr:CLUMA_CG001409, isoform A [Clunio marinus]